MTVRHALRWIATPVAAIAAMVTTYLVTRYIVMLLHMVVSPRMLDRIVRPDLASGVGFACVSFATVVGASAVAPSRRTMAATLVFVAGAALAWEVLADWSMPEWHPRAYQESIVPFVLTLAGGVAGIALVAHRWRTRPRI